MNKILMLLLVLVGLASTAFGVVEKQTSVNQWVVGYESEAYDRYITSAEVNTIPVEVDFSQREHTFYFYVDNINPSGFNTYQAIAEDENLSRVTLHIAGDHNNLARIISPDDYDPRKPYAVNYNNVRRVVMKFTMPSEFTKSDVFNVGLRAKSLEGENKQILLQIKQKSSKVETPGINFQKIGLIIGLIIGALVVIVLGKRIFRKKGRT